MTDQEIKDIIIETSKLRSQCDMGRVLDIIYSMAESDKDDLNNFLSLNYSIYTYITYQMIRYQELMESKECGSC